VVAAVAVVLVAFLGVVVVAAVRSRND